MMVGRWRALTLVAVILASLSVGPAAVTGASPAGVSGSCSAKILGGPPSVFDIGGSSLLGGAGSGSCVTTSLDGWALIVLVRLQVKVGGVWTTRATARTSIGGTKATKRVDYLEAGFACTSAAARLWRVRVTTSADIGNEASVIIATHTETSAAVSRHC